MGQHCIHSLAFKMKTKCFLSIWSTSELFNILEALVLLKLREQTGFFLSVYSTHPTLAPALCSADPSSSGSLSFPEGPVSLLPPLFFLPSLHYSCCSLSRIFFPLKFLCFPFFHKGVPWKTCFSATETISHLQHRENSPGFASPAMLFIPLGTEQAAPVPDLLISPIHWDVGTYIVFVIIICLTMGAVAPGGSSRNSIAIIRI